LLLSPPSLVEAPMRLRTILYLYRMRLRARLVQELLAVAGIAVGVALLFASQVANTSLSGSVGQLTNELIGKSRLQLTARGPLGFRQSLLGEVQRLPGVQAAAPLLQRSVNLVGPKGSASVDLIGVSATFASLDAPIIQRVGQLRFPSQQGVALPAPVARRVGVGSLQSLQLQVNGRSRRTVAAVILQGYDIGELVDSPIAIAPLGVSQQLTDMQGRVNRLIVDPSPGSEHVVRRELLALAGDRLNVTPASEDAAIFARAEAPASQSTALFSVISALVGFMFAFNAMLLTLPQRRSLIGDLRLDGYSPLETSEMMLFDAFVLGIAGSILGLLLGELLSSELLRENPGYLSFAFPVASVRVVRLQSVVLACAGGVAAAAVGILVPLRQDIVPRELSKRQGRKPVHVSVWLSLLCLLGGLVVTGVALLSGIGDVVTAILVFAALTVAMLASLPSVFRLAVEALDWIQRPLKSVSSRIAVIELQSRSTRVRSLAIAATGAIAVFGSVAIEGARHNLENGLGAVARETTRAADIWVTQRGSANTLATTPFPAAETAMLRKTTGVVSVRPYRGGFLDVGTRRMLVIAEPRDSPLLLAPGQVIRGDQTRARRLLRGRGWVALSGSATDALGLRIGQSFTLPTPRPSTFRLAAVTTNFGWPPGALIMNADNFASSWGSSDVSAYQVDVDPRVSVETVQRQIQAQLGPRSALSVQTGQQREQSYRATLRQGLLRLSDITALVLIAAVLAMTAAMGAMIWQRRARLAGMKVDGFGQGELWRALLCESAVLLGTGCLIGAVFGLFGQVVLGRALAGITGFPVSVAVSGTIAILIVAVVTLVAVVMLALPGYLATQVRPAVQD
jgi:putative ABC transport system permease protein